MTGNKKPDLHKSRVLKDYFTYFNIPAKGSVRESEKTSTAAVTLPA